MSGPQAGLDLARSVDEIGNRWPSVGLAVAVVAGGGMSEFAGRGMADIAAHAPVTEHTAFRVASVTKTFTAVAVMQLVEDGLVELDRPADDYLRSHRLRPARAGLGPVTVRHLLTHAAGIREVLHPTDLLRMRDLGETVPVGRHVPRLAEYYRGNLRYDIEPGTTFAYTNHGFATLGQLLEDVTGDPLPDHLREHVFEPLGMDGTGLVRPGDTGAHAATPYELRRAGAAAIPAYEVITAGGGGAWSTAADMARYVAALLAGGAGERGRVLRPATVEAMFAPQLRPDPRVPGSVWASSGSTSVVGPGSSTTASCPASTRR